MKTLNFKLQLLTFNFVLLAVLIPQTFNFSLSTFNLNTAHAGFLINRPLYIGLGEGLVGYWSFNGADMAADTAFDKSGQGNNGTLTNGPVPAIGKIGQALNFDGVDDYVNVGTGLDQNGEVTVSAWFKTTTISGGARIIVANSNSSLGDYTLELNRTTGKLAALWDNTVILTGNTAVSVNTWYHAVMVRSGSSGNWTATLYLNGVSDGSAITATDPNGTNQKTYIGAIHPGTTFLFSGLIDEVRVYNRALTADEIKRLYNMGR